MRKATESDSDPFRCEPSPLGLSAQCHARSGLTTPRLISILVRLRQYFERKAIQAFVFPILPKSGVPIVRAPGLISMFEVKSP